jgi:NUMOD4 motif/HNH endonuclease
VTQPTEQWRPVVGYEGLYEVSDRGRVRSLDTVDSLGRKHAGQIRKLTIATNGYMQLALNRDGHKRIHRVHRLVLEAFVGPAPEGADGCHADGSRDNNHVSNLRWDTRSANLLEAVEHGTNRESRKTHCPNGHQLVKPNLFRASIHRGSRGECRACAGEKQSAKYHRRPFDTARADERYAGIMAGRRPQRRSHHGG